MVLDVFKSTINSDHLLQVSIQITKIFYKLSSLPNHRLSAKHSSDVHLPGIDLHYLVHNGHLVFLSKNDDLIFLRQSFEHVFKTRPDCSLDSLAENIFRLKNSARKVED